jgi:elongation factor G
VSDSRVPIRSIISVPVVPKTDGHREAFQRALSGLIEEDPTLKISAPSADGRVFICGESEPHLESACDMVLRKLQIELDVGEPKVIYLETIRRPSEGEGKYIRQTGGQGNYGHVRLRLEPGESGSGFQFVNEMREGQIPQEFVGAIIGGILDAAVQGTLAGYEMVDLRAVLFDGSYHDRDSNEMAFRFAGAIAFKEAARKAFPVVLEPVMSVEVEVAEENLTDAVGDLNRRRGRIEDVKHRGIFVIYHAIVPLAEMLRSSAHGRPAYPMHFAGYEPALLEGWDNADGAGVTANKPEGPNAGRHFASANPEIESE